MRCFFEMISSLQKFVGYDRIKEQKAYVIRTGEEGKKVCEILTGEDILGDLESRGPLMTIQMS